jgi:hypothetical protein
LVSLVRQQTTEQYERYVNRFGPGMVIYWHGFIADLNNVRCCALLPALSDSALAEELMPSTDDEQYIRNVSGAHCPCCRTSMYC